MKPCTIVTCNHVFLLLPYLILVTSSTISCYGIPFHLVFCTIIFCVGAGISFLMSDILSPYFSCRKMEKMRPMREKIDGKVFISRQSWLFSFIVNMIKVLFPICTSTWRVSNYVSRQGKFINSRNESSSIIKIIVMLKHFSHFVT